MWTPAQQPLSNWNSGKIIPKVVLYSYDGPVIFTADVGLTEFIFYKVGEDPNSDLYLVTPASQSVIDALKRRTLSLRGALDHPNLWVVDVAPDNEVRRYWSVRPHDIPADLLPDFGLGLSPSKMPAADILEQAISFFSTRFLGEGLSPQSIPFMRFKTLIDGAYDAFRKIFPPPVVEARSLERSLDFNLLQPKFSSLIVAIDRPQVNASEAKKILKKDINPDLFTEGFEKNRQDFFDRMNELLVEAEKGEIKKAYAVEHFYTLDQVNNIVPTSSNELDRVEFRSHLASLKPVALDDRLGDKFRSAHRIAEILPRQVTGVILEINEASGTMVIRDDSSRQVTCIFERSDYESLDVAIGTKIRLRGNYIKRYRRDKILVSGSPHIVP